MPYSVCKKLNAKLQIQKTKIIQLDRSHVKILGELKDVLIHLSSNCKVHQMIEIIFVDILEAYLMILRKYWSAKLNEYFETDWSHLWLPYKDQPNKIKVECEHYMKHMVTDLNDTNEPVMFSNFILGNFYFDRFFGELEAELSPLTNSEKKSELLHTTQIAEPHCTIVDDYTNVDSNTCTNIVFSSTNISLAIIDPQIQTLYFDGSMNKEGAGARCILIICMATK